MNVPFADLHRQYLSLKDQIDKAMAEVISESAYIGTSANRFVRRFEEDFSRFSGARHCIACANGTDALEIALRAGGIGPGDEVIVPAVTWIATSEAVTNVGGIPVFADVHPDHYTLDPDQVAARIGPKTKAIVPVHLYGLPADMDPLMTLAREFGLFVLEDCAQAHGAEYKGRPVGTIGHAGAFSFFPGKNLGAYGDAGGLITNDSDLAGLARIIGQHGQGQEKFEHQIEGRNSRMDGLQAAVLSVKLPHLSSWTERRIQIAESYQKALQGLSLKLPARPDGVRHVFHLFAIQVNGRDGIRRDLADKGIATGLQYPQALPFVRAYSERNFLQEDFPNALQLAGNVLTLPIFPEMDLGMVDEVVSGMQNCLGSNG